MTVNKAIRVTGLDIRRTDTHTFGAYNEGGKVAEATHRKDTIALTLLVNAVYRKRGLEAMAEADFRCERCGQRAPLHTHHKVHRSQGRDDSKTNLEVLCFRCHEAEHRGEKSK